MLHLKKATELVPLIKKLYVLGTVIELKVYGENAKIAIDESVQKLLEIDDRMSVFKEDSEVSKINYYAGAMQQKVSEDTFYVLENSLKYSDLSQGAFDTTIRPLVDVWGFGRSYQKIPHKQEIENALKLVNYKNISIDRSKKTVMLKNFNQSIDLGSIAKGFAADKVRDILIENGIKSAIIDLGGNIYAYGRKENGLTWNIGIQNPFGESFDYVGAISVSNKSVVTSGNYERFFIADGKRYHHILDPRTGYPSENGLISVSIISDNSIDGDALSTCAYVMGLERGYNLIEKLDGVDAIFITEDKKVYLTSGLRHNFVPVNYGFIYILY